MTGTTMQTMMITMIMDVHGGSESTGVEEDQDNDEPVERLRLDYSSAELATSTVGPMEPPTIPNVYTTNNPQLLVLIFTLLF